MPSISPQHPVAYFCAEFGLEANLPIYAGGLGVLAGDTLKAAADEKLPMVGIGLLYRGNGAKQVISLDGMQSEQDVDFDPLNAGLEHVYVDDQPLFIHVHLTQVDVWLRVWKKQIGEIALYLLDSETDQNELNERGITHVLYPASEDVSIKQQVLLSVGGVKLLHSLGIHPSIYHVQEGRASLVHWQLIRSYMDNHGMSFRQAFDLAKSKTVYTNHTLVAAGIGQAKSDLLKMYGQYYAQKMGVSIEALIDPGNEPDKTDFSFTRLALNTARRASGVSQLHTALSSKLWPEYDWVNITNGVHLPTWQQENIRVNKDDPKKLWQSHQENKKELAKFVKNRTGFTFDSDRLVIAWARRIAGYKRYDALYQDMERLVKIVKNEQRPVQILMAGKAHRLDEQGKVILQQVIHHFQNELSGNALFIPDYDLDVARYLVSGCDVWLNTPEKGNEASGTSGMKAISNGVLQLTVADGWAGEVDWPKYGWTLDSDNISESIYERLEGEVVPMYFVRNKYGFSPDWVELMHNSIDLAESFSAKRMIREYVEKLYD